jgi:3-methyladenine DNA glycosylase AlkD
MIKKLDGIALDVDNVAAEIAARLRRLPKCDTQHVRAVRKEYSRKLAKASPGVIICLAQRLLTQIDLRFVAYELISHHPAALKSVGAKELEQLGRGIDSWGAVDTFACYLGGPVWRERQVSAELIHGWAASSDRWWRRAALVSTVPLNNKTQGGKGDSVRTLRVCRLLILDRDDMVVKAMSWSLRELAKREPENVRRFLLRHEKELAPRVLREVRNKLDTGRKNPKQ